MSLESFFGLEDGESSGSAESAEKFREQMRKNARAIKAMGAHQQKKKKKEDRLAQILVKFLQDQSKTEVVFLVVKLLQENVPGAFILAILAIANAELEKELELHFQENKPEQSEAGSPQAEPKSLIHFAGDSELPEQVKLELNAWGEAILKAGLMLPGRTLETVLTPEQKLKSIVLDLINYSLEEYFDRHGLDFSPQKVKQFALLSIQSVLVQLRNASMQKSDAEIIETPLEEESTEIQSLNPNM